MAFPASAHGWSGGNVTGPVVIQSPAGATDDSDDVLEVLDDQSHAIFSVTADGTMRLSRSPTASAETNFLLNSNGFDNRLIGEWLQLGASILLTPTHTILIDSSAIADNTLSASQMQLWLDDTPGATKLRVKAKDSGGTVRTATIALA